MSQAVVQGAVQKREARLAQRVASFGGRLDYREEPDGNGMGSVILTYEFDSLERAAAAAEALREHGEHVEGPGDYAQGEMDGS